MEPVTHFLTGACIGRAGFNRKTAYATLAAVLAAEAADLDILWALAGPVEELKHHSGNTHTLVAAPVVAGVVVAGVWALDSLIQWRRRRSPAVAHELNQKMKVPTAPPKTPLRWGWLYATALVAALSHLLLDWTNNYGVRPFFPFNPRWYAGSIVFIAEPVLWGVFALALAVPWVLGLADNEIGVRQQRHRGQGWAKFALVAMVGLWGWRWFEHEQGLAMIAKTQVASEPVKRIALEPYPVNPYRWHAILETADFYQTAEVNTSNPDAMDAIVSNPQRDVMWKPTDTPAVEAAKQTLLGQVYLDWGVWAVVRDLGQQPVAGMAPPELPPGRTWTTVGFTDLRFDYELLAAPARLGRSPLGGWVYIVDAHEDAGMAMGGREQH